MALQFSTTLRNNMLNANTAITEVWNTTLGTSATLLIYTGSVPASCATAASGTLLATITLQSAPFGVSTSQAITLAGLTLSATPSNSGNAGYFRILDGSSVCHVQGTCGTSGADLNFNTVALTSGLANGVQITGFTITAPGA
jgi:hypothetical protein